jgi:hypothetical protein
MTQAETPPAETAETEAGGRQACAPPVQAETRLVLAPRVGDGFALGCGFSLAAGLGVLIALALTSLAMFGLGIGVPSPEQLLRVVR